ncbi:SAM-dependent methyltransferase [Actinomycetospora sp. NBRC 106375]|uniref:class I SAM-dependent methyltransferase n=1 Tax=Actinomycetospora sp. NBRC 106375 TaxID=3032207 RepID=UPI0024A1C9B6|nr:class I SAM-dependent methyltransferase [Actinomycetospora sp. NBRC 106375]GLZ47471.1 SAM-dependent methyltransferase [Actinomycetospora sp. NBRC 106375]
MTTTKPAVNVDPAVLEALVGQIVTDAGAALVVPLGLLGDRLGLFTAMAGRDAMTAAQLAAETGLSERYLREWLMTMAAAGYITYDGGDTDGSARSGRFRLSPEQAEVFTNADSPAYLAGAFQNLTAATRMLDRLTEAFRTGEGIGWHEQHEDMFRGTERFFRPGYLANLTGSWIPALTGIDERLRAGGTVADVGCGLGSSTIIMAEAYPRATFVGLDYHPGSVELARGRADAAGVADRVTFRVGPAIDLAGQYDLVTFFDCLHDMPDPVGALRAARSAVGDGGSVMLVEPMSWDTVPEALNPLGRLLFGASMFVCLPSGLSADPGAGLGNQAGPTRTCELAREAGFGDARLATSTEVNLVYELRP